MTDNDNSSGNAIVTIVAIVVIAILAYFVIQMLQNQTAPDDATINIPDVNITTTAGDTAGE